METLNFSRDSFSIYRFRSRRYCSVTCLAYPRNSSPSGVTTIPLLVRRKSSKPSSFSSSFTAPDKLGCEINKAFAASFIEPWSATAITYLNCCNVMIYPPFSKYCTPASDIPPVSVHEYRHVPRIHGILLTDFQNSPSEISSSVHRR